MSVILIGYRGSGKTSVGRALASRLGWAFVDADELLTARAQMSIKEIFERHGEDYFRDLECGIVQELCKRSDHVIALGGGVVMRDGNREALKASGASIVYLHSDPETLYDRIRSDPKTAATRPSLTKLGGGVAEVRTMLLKRLPLYREIKTHEINVTHLSAEQVAERVAAMVSQA